MIRGIIFDFGNTLIYQVPDNDKTLDEWDLKFFPGALECINELSQHFKIAILSNTESTTSKQLKKALDKAGLCIMDIEAFTSTSIGIKKPNHRAFQFVLDQMQLNPDETVMIGNDLVEDVEGAQNAGLHTILIAKEEIDSKIKADVRVSRIDHVTYDLINVISKLDPTYSHKRRIDKNNNTLLDSSCALDAINMERNQEWRKIGSTWLSCALEMKASDKEMLGEYLDPEATIHNFPYFNVDKWVKLSEVERAGRAYRYAGYHFEADGDRQSAYRLYRASAKCYEEEKRYDEAGRSHFLSLKSYINRFGEADKKYLEDLERSTKIAVNYDEPLYLKRMIIYYRTLYSLLKSKGNYLASLDMRKKRIDAERLLLKKIKTYHLYILSSMWNFFTGCGQGLIRWVLTLLLATLVIFPILYRWIDCLGQTISFKDALIFSISRLVNYNIVNYTPTNIGHTIIIIQAIFLLFWVGALLSIIFSRIQN